MEKRMRDKGMAPPFRDQSEPGDGENINIEAEAQGRAVNIFAASDNLTRKGEANFTGPFREVVGKENLLTGKGGFVNENRGERPDTERGVE